MHVAGQTPGIINVHVTKTYLLMLNTFAFCVKRNGINSNSNGLRSLYCSVKVMDQIGALYRPVLAVRVGFY